MTYAELQVTSNFSFLRGASHGEELVLQAKHLGLKAIALTDHNSLAGIVRAHVQAKETGLRFVVGARLDLEPGGPPPPAPRIKSGAGSPPEGEGGSCTLRPAPSPLVGEGWGGGGPGSDPSTSLRSSLAPTTKCKPVSFACTWARTMPASELWSVMAMASRPRCLAWTTSSSPCEAPRRKEKLLVTWSSAYFMRTDHG